MFKKIKSNKLLAGSSVYLLSNILNAVIPFLLLPILTRYLIPAEYGQVAMFQTLLGALGAFVGVSVVGAAGRKHYDENLTDTEMGRYIGSCFHLLFVSAVVVFIPIFFFRDKLSVWLSLDEKWVLWAVLISVFVVIMNLRLGQWQVRQKAKSYGAMQVSRSVLDMGLSLLFVVVLLSGAGGRISAQIITAGLFAFLAVCLLKRDQLLTFFVWEKSYYKEILRFGVPLIPHVSGGFLVLSVDRFIVNSELGLAEAGVYMVAVQLAAGAALVFDAINKAYVPWLFERLKENNYKQKVRIVRYTYFWFFIIILASGIGFLVGPWIVKIIAGSGYERAGSIIGFLILGQVFGGMYHMMTSYVFFSKRTGLLSLATVVSGLINVLLLFFLVPLFGLNGAAYSFVIAMIFRFVLTWWVAQYRYPMPWLSARVWGRG